ncbi:MAG TPA: hypothetical protein VMU93_08125 [Caulobacteraceae bacterium]|nr:hypothetical protein [Caulobacteraceae bacterium]
MRRLLCALAFALVAGAAASKPAATPTPAPRTVIVGPTGRTLILTPEVLAGARRAHATMVDHGAPHVYAGVELDPLLRMVGAPTGVMVHGAAVRDYLVVTGADGFRAVLSLAGTDPGVQPRPVILADRKDGAPLDARDAPFRLVVDGDRQPARSVRAVARIQVEALH